MRGAQNVACYWTNTETLYDIQYELVAGWWFYWCRWIRSSHHHCSRKRQKRNDFVAFVSRHNGCQGRVTLTQHYGLWWAARILDHQEWPCSKPSPWRNFSDRIDKRNSHRPNRSTVDCRTDTMMPFVAMTIAIYDTSIHSQICRLNEKQIHEQYYNFSFSWAKHLLITVDGVTHFVPTSGLCS